MLREWIKKNRSYRRFHEEERITKDTLVELVELARFSASGANLQPLKYKLSFEPEENARIFPHLAWAGYLKEWKGPEQGERPAGYIILLGDTKIAKNFGCDHGIAAQSILLGATEKGLGGCMIASVKKKELCEEMNLPSHLELLLVIALGKPKEEVVVDDLAPEGDIKYWRDEGQVHHVPKRTLDELIL